MKFEEVLPLMREGKRARHGRMKENEYWTCGYASMEGIEKWLTLVKIFDNPFESEKSVDVSSWAWGIERWAIMCDTWEIIE